MLSKMDQGTILPVCTARPQLSADFGVDDDFLAAGAVMAVNLEAAEEIAYQLRLRNLSGIIIVDLINMRNRDHIMEVEERFRAGLSADPHKAVLADITRLGLAEITRQKKRKPFRTVFTIS